MWNYSLGVNPVSTTLSSGPSAGGTSFTITSATGLPTIATGSFGTARIQAEGSNTAEDIIYTRSGTTITLANSTVLASAHASSAAIDFDVQSSAALDQLKQDALSGGPHGSNITTTANLVLGIMNFVNLTAASVTLTIPAAAFDGQLVGIQMLDTCTKLATLSPTGGSVKIDNTLTRIMWAGEIAWLAWDAANTMWRKVAGKSIPMVCTMYLAGNLTPTVDSTETQILLDTTEIDNTGLMANIGSNKITIKRPAYYVATGFNVITGALIGAAKGIVKQNSTNIIVGLQNCTTLGFATQGGVKPSLCAAADDFKLYYSQNSGGTTPTIVGGAAVTYLSVTEVLGW